ncbi:unnamed protein product, partial [Allacma fusca]
ADVCSANCSSRTIRDTRGNADALHASEDAGPLPIYS